MNAARLWVPGSLLLLVAAGCRQVRDISAAPPYSAWVGARYCLKCEAELLNEGTLLPSYSVCFERLRGSSDGWVVCKLPEGYPVKVEAVKRVTGRTLIGDIPFTEEYAVISLDHPTRPGSRIRAELPLASFERLRVPEPGEQR